MEPIPKMKYTKHGELKICGRTRTYRVVLLILVTIITSMAVGSGLGYYWSYEVNTRPLIYELAKSKEKIEELRKGYNPPIITPKPKNKP